MNESVYSSRRERLAQAMREAGIDALIASTPETMGYLHGFHESGHERLLVLCIRASGEVRLIAPALSLEQASRAGIADIKTWSDGEDPMALFRALAAEWDLEASVIAVDNDLSAAKLLAMQAALPAALFQPAQPVISSLMRSKGPEELEAMHKASHIADEALALALGQLHAGMSEKEFGSLLAAEMRKLGGEPTFSIVATGANGAEPHHLSDDTIIKSGDVIVIDYGCQVDGYQSDVTRTVALGQASEEAKSVYRIVYEAHQAARREIAPGVACQCIDRGARDVIEHSGYGRFFNHRTGHGIGLRTHEEPYIVEGNTFELESGNCFSIEPGIYLPGKFGVRIENIVSVSADGHVSLNDEPTAEIQEV